MGREFLSIAYEGLAVLLIDMQPHFINDDKKWQIVPNQIEIIRFCAKNNVPFVVLEFNHRGQTIQDLTKEIKKIPKKNVSWIKKYYNDGFKDTVLNAQLQKKRIQTLLLMGINAGYCVYATSKSAIKYGYKIVTCGDLIAGYEGNNESHCTGPEWYMSNGVYISSYKILLQS